jgi:Ca-activated chloride channel family protein
MLMLGNYEQAIAAYDLALEQRPDWLPAMENRALAAVRLARLTPVEDDAGGTGGMLEADEFVFDATGRVNQSQAEQTIETDTGLTDTQLRELWLRRVNTRPADFLRARFAVQLARQSAEDK